MFQSRPFAQLFSSAILCLFLARYFYVAESAWQGDTLWIVGLWFVALMFWAIVAWKGSVPLAEWNWLDCGVGLLAGGHLVSALVIVATTGDKRSAANLGWEWGGIACCWWLLRQMCQDFSFRREVLIAIIAIGTSMAGLGIYQHYVDFPRMALKYGEMFDRLNHVNGVEAEKIRKELANDNIPMDGTARILFEKRLRDSREPLGPFALANTLGGFLAVCLILTASITVAIMRPAEQGAWKRLAPWIAIILVLAWCLLLTKSRTAWIDTALGLALLGFSTRRNSVAGRSWKIAIGAMIGLVLAGWGLSRAGGLDRQVLTEAPKSLQYRLQYWSATLPMIANHLVFGVGPGQFRSHYLIYKLPEASEAISDPHNLFFDVAANGGLVALSGLFVICIALAGKLRSPQAEVTPQTASASALVPKALTGIAGAAWLGIYISGWDDRLLILLPISVALFWALRSILVVTNLGTKPVSKTNRELNPSIPKNVDSIAGHRSSKESGDVSFAGIDRFDMTKSIRIGSLSAAIGLIVHLCGAGGIGMPAVALLLLALVAVADGGRSAAMSGKLPISTAALIVATSIGLMIGLYMTGLRPVMVAQARITAGDRLLQRGFLDAADAEYSAAAAADNWSVEPWRRRAELAFRKSVGQQFRSNDLFLVAVQMLRESKSRDPVSYSDDLKSGEWWSLRWRTTKDAKDADEAVGAFRRALAGYPTSAALMAELAVALESAGDERESTAMAKRALEQDSINRKWGHVDKFLDEQSRIRMEELSLR